jgi:hypothetical protein
VTANPVPEWLAEPTPEAAKSFAKSRRFFLDQIGSELSLTEAQRALVQENFHRREDEEQSARQEAQSGALDRSGYYDRIHAANERFYDRTEQFLDHDKRLLLQRFRKQSQSAVETLRGQGQPRH